MPLLLALALLAGCEKYTLDRQMEELCRVDGGVVVYERVQLPSAEFDASGTPLARYWFDPSRVASKDRLGPEYAYTRRKETINEGDPMAGQGQLTRYIEEIHRKSDMKLLGRSIWYGRAGGDGFLIYISDHFSGAGCPVQGKPLLPAVFTKGPDQK